MNLILYVLTVLIWGTTWLAIALQLGSVPVVVSVFYRFALAAVILLAIMLLTKKLQPTSGRDQQFMLLQGACLFSCNFLFFYNATAYISSGLVAVVFSLATVFNAINNRLFYRETIPKTVLIAAVFGVIGLLLLFLPELQSSTSFDREIKTTLFGLLLAALGTYCFSLGNMISKRHSLRGLRPATSNAYAMTYGAIILAAILLVQQQPLVIDSEMPYLASLLYLSVIGSIVGFTLYLTLVARIGTNRAAYATVLFPIIALLLSSIYEDYQWQLSGILGLVLTMLGNLVINSDAIVKQWQRTSKMP